MIREITPGVYRHFTGNRYEVLCIAQHTENKKRLVIYKALYGDQKIYARPLRMFASKVDHIKYPDAQQEYRFERDEGGAV